MHARSPSARPRADDEAAAIRDRFALAAVLITWLGMLTWALCYIRAFAPPFPIGDEFALYDLLPPIGSFSWKALWKLHNEHVIPLPRLVEYPAYVLTGDLHATEYLQALVLGTVALGMIFLVRRLRGRTDWTDTLFPLVWLHVGNWTNLTSGFQLALTLPTAIACAILAGIAISPGLPSVRRAIGIAGCFVSLPLCGAAGLTQVPALGIWLAWLGWSGHRSPERGERKGGRILLGGVVLSVVIGALYLRRLEASGLPSYPFEPMAFLKCAAALFSLGLGPAAETLWPASGALVLFVLAATILRLATGLLRDPVEIRRRLGLLASMAGIVSLVASIGIGRSHLGWERGFLSRYVTLTAPLLCCAHVAWTLYGGRGARTLACGLLAITAWAVLPINARIGNRMGRDVRDRVERFEGQIARGASPLELVESFTEQFPHHLPEVSRRTLRTLAVLGKPPFDRAPAPSGEAFDYLNFSRFPSEVRSDRPTYWRVADGGEALQVHAGTEIHIDMLAGERRISGRFGVHPEMINQWKSGPVRILVESVTPQGASRILLDRTIDPTSVESDRGSHAFALEEPLEVPCDIVLRTESALGPASQQSWSYWADIRIE